LKSIKVNHVEICGDTRFDRVLEIKNNFKSIPELEKFKGQNKLIIAGSTWPRDEDLLLECFRRLDLPDTKLVIVPHDIEASLLKDTFAKLKMHELSYCSFTEGIKADAKVLVLNTMGLLSRSYHYCNVAYIGGGFDGGIHNCLEAAVYGVPVLFYGSDFQKYNEAVDLTGIKAAFHVNSVEELNERMKFSLNEKNASEITLKLNSYFEKKGNVTGKILSRITF
jgi:3-deoxy-D-manno-octulosonic-acid transferase